ncbi:cyclin-T1-4-like [Rutidosis leptorrhynchoides]|uniref:cyclin-T1-4-like n=1 Tax=Rutidosis leptorrhynchoides TaxID=125765 RepID=UPI003A9913E7
MAVQVQCGNSQKEVAKDASELLTAEAHLSLTQKWFFSKKEIECSTPSRSDGIDYEQEEHLRKLYCSFLQELGVELKVPQVTIATALMFCHRFYMRQSHAKNDWQTVATVCMFLACKAEETPRWLNELIVVAYKLIYKWDPSASRRIREIYDRQKELILIGERLLLNTIAFDLNIEHPYKSLVASLKRLDITHKELAKVAWNFVNDWLRTSMCLQHKPHYIAAGSLFLAAKVTHVKLVTTKGKAWWMEFDVSPKQLEDVIQQMMRSLEQGQSQPKPVKVQNVTKSLTNKPTSYSPQSFTLSGSSNVDVSTTIPSKDARKPAKPVTSNSVTKSLTTKPTTNKPLSTVDVSKTIPSKDTGEPAKPATSNFVNTIGEAPKCQTSDTGSAASVVEDGDSGEPVAVKSDLSSSFKLVSVGATVSNRVDVNAIREKLKKMINLQNVKRKRVEDTGDDIDDEAWIEKELEDVVVSESSHSKKQMKI